MNYIGSKIKLLPFIEEVISEVADKSCLTFCDLFAGTGSVGKHFKRLGYDIISNDLQYYSYVLNRASIHGNSFPQFQKLSEVLGFEHTHTHERILAICNYLENIEPVKGFVYNNYCKGDKGEDYRMYFNDENGALCDAIRLKIEEWRTDSIISDDEYFFLLATLIDSIDNVANTTSVYGAFLKHYKTRAQQKVKLKPIEFIENVRENQTCLVYNEDANTLIQKVNTDILYLDPPYNERQYSSNYHVLETIAKYDNPTLKGKTGTRDWSSQKSLYCSKRSVIQAFEQLILNANAKYIFLSYNNEGLMSFSDIQNIMSRRGEYGCFEKRYRRYKSDRQSENRNIKSDETVEYIHYIKI